MDIAQGRAVVDEAGVGRAHHAIRFLVVVPDGVAKVSVVFAQRSTAYANTIEFLDSKTPHGNVVAFQALGATVRQATGHDLGGAHRKGHQAHTAAYRPSGLER